MVALSFGLLKSRPLSLSGEIPVLSFRSDLIKFQKRYYLVGMLSSFSPVSMMVLMCEWYACRSSFCVSDLQYLYFLMSVAFLLLFILV